jgi:hypothetical protein
VDLACSSRKSTTKFSTAERRHQFTLVSTRSSSDLSPVSATPETDPTNQASYGNDHSSSFVPAKHCRLTPRTRRNFEREKRRPETRLGSAIFGSKMPGEAAKPRRRNCGWSRTENTHRMCTATADDDDERQGGNGPPTSAPDSQRQEIKIPPPLRVSLPNIHS